MEGVDLQNLNAMTSQVAGFANEFFQDILDAAAAGSLGQEAINVANKQVAAGLKNATKNRSAGGENWMFRFDFNRVYFILKPQL